MTGHILLIEDNHENATMMTRLLETEGYQVKHYDRGLEGTRAARSDRPAVILLDFDLPDIDGRSLILVLRRQLGMDSAPPIIAVTARVSQMERMVARRFGCDAFIGKPFDPQDFLTVVSRFMPKKTDQAQSVPNENT
ncbi:MAG: response regulator [Phototrophicaceae bacterium]